MAVLQWILKRWGYLLWQMHFNLHFWLLKIIRSYVNVRKVESISGTLVFSLGLMCRSLVYDNPVEIAVHHVERYINCFKSMKNSRAYRIRWPFRCIESNPLTFLRRFYRNPLLFLNLINTDVEPNEIVSRTSSTEFVNYYLPMNLLIIRNTLEIVIYTNFISSTNFEVKLFETKITLREDCKISFTQIILTNKKIMRNKASTYPKYIDLVSM